MPLIHKTIADHLSSNDMLNIAQELGFWLQEGNPESMARTLVERARQHLRLDRLFALVKSKRSQVDLNPHLYELVAATFNKEEMIDLCRRLGLDQAGGGLDAAGLIGWGHDPFLQRQKAKTVQDHTETADFLTAIAQVRPEMDLSAFGKTTDAQTTSLTAAQIATNDKQARAQVLYENFDLIVSKIAGTYVIQASYAQGGEVRVEGAALNLIEEKDVQDLLVTLDNLSGDGDLAETVGEMMRERLFPNDIWNLFTNAKGSARDNLDSGLRVRLRIGPAEIGMLPWEYCFDHDYDFLAMRRDLPLVRYIDQKFIPDDIEAPRPTKVLVVSANPTVPKGEGKLHRLDPDAEAEQITAELQPLVDEGELMIHHIKSVTWDDFQSGMVNFEPHILHFIGHGTYDIDKERGYLLLEDETGSPHEIGSRVLGRLFRGTSVKVLILNACQTAAFGQHNAFMGLAPALVKAEIPAVIAMQFAMPDKTAGRFAQKMYHYLAMGLPLDRAITEARINIVAHDDTFWAVPVLFMRSKDGVIWQERKLLM